MNATTRFTLLAAAALVAAGCVKETRPLPVLQATQATTEIPDAQLLDVGVHIFDPGIPKQLEENPDLAPKLLIYPEIRRAEARFAAMQLRDTLEGTGHWGTARVVPASVTSFDVTVDGRIVESNGKYLTLEITATDATGRVWIRKQEFEGLADTRAYKDGYSAGRDPFENVYVHIANALLEARGKLPPAEVANIRRVSELRFAVDFAPVAFGQYLEQDRRSGQYRVLRLPADDDVMLGRIRQIRDRDYGMIDTVSENYAAFSERLEEPYTYWRRFTYDEIVAAEKVKQQARNRMLMGAAAIAAAVMVPDSCNSSSCARMADYARYGAMAGGVAGVISGYRKREEAKIHEETLKEMSGSFESEAAPLIVDVEGRTLRLTGTAEEQYAEWRKLLHELYKEETGLVPVAPLAPAAGAAAQGARPAGAG
ncbi:MAG: hypothetical protein KF822_05505 [Steroidobacteraceae bacterium]|nr:hypothetical protein [Steroidobacteraceae bacterium]